MNLSLDSFGESLNIVVVGATGGIGQSLVAELSTHTKTNQVFALSRRPSSNPYSNVHELYFDLTDEASMEATAKEVGLEQELDMILVTTGLLHEEGVLKPEKRLGDLNANHLAQSFAINTIGPALIAKHFLPKLRRDNKSVFAALSARVGSLEDNRLGGWYGYRASKAALNMFIKTASIEVKRRNKQAIVMSYHPGTVDTDLSKPFQNSVPEGKLFTPRFAAQRLLTVLEQVTAQDTGKHFAWDGQQVPY